MRALLVDAATGADGGFAGGEPVPAGTRRRRIWPRRGEDAGADELPPVMALLFRESDSLDSFELEYREHVLLLEHSASDAPHRVEVEAGPPTTLDADLPAGLAARGLEGDLLVLYLTPED